MNLRLCYVISSIPITELVNLLEPELPNEVLQASRKLKFRCHLSLFITLNKPSVFSDQWIYFPEKEIPFARIMEPKNFRKKMPPQDKTSLLVEYFCWEKDSAWNADSIHWIRTATEIRQQNNFLTSSNDQAHGPLLAWTNGIIAKAAPDSLYLYNLWNIFVSLLGVWGIYYFCRKIWKEEKLASLSTFLLSTSLVYLYLARTPMYDLRLPYSTFYTPVFTCSISLRTKESTWCFR